MQTVADVVDSTVMLAEDRSLFEAAVLRRYGSTLTREDAEDVVSEALLRSASRCPATTRDEARAWFTRVALNRAEDYRRARDGRPRSGRGRTASGPTVSRRFVALELAPEVSQLRSDSDLPAAAADAAAAGAETASSVRAVLERLDVDHARALWLRHMSNDGDGMTRQEVAHAMGISVARYERIYTEARKAFIAAAASLSPHPDCATARAVLRTRERAHSNWAPFARAHVSGCTSCRIAVAMAEHATVAA